MRVTDTYTFFYGSSEVFSNWYKKNFSHNELIFNCSEQAMMYEKAILFGDIETADKIMKTKDPKEQKALGRLVKNFNEATWLQYRDDIMFRVLCSKFMVPDLQTKLLATPNTYFVEASPYDKNWGIGMREYDAGIEDPKNWKGLNLLGNALNKVRDHILTKAIH